MLPLFQGGIIYDGLVAMAFIYVCYLAYMSRQIYATARDMLLLRDDKNELIEALGKSKSHLIVRWNARKRPVAPNRNSSPI